LLKMASPKLSSSAQAVGCIRHISVRMLGLNVKSSWFSKYALLQYVHVITCRPWNQKIQQASHEIPHEPLQSIWFVAVFICGTRSCWKGPSIRCHVRGHQAPMKQWNQKWCCKVDHEGPVAWRLVSTLWSFDTSFDGSSATFAIYVTAMCMIASFSFFFGTQFDVLKTEYRSIKTWDVQESSEYIEACQKGQKG
jgi:hypothetical protein